MSFRRAARRSAALATLMVGIGLYTLAPPAAGGTTFTATALDVATNPK